LAHFQARLAVAGAAPTTTRTESKLPQSLQDLVGYLYEESKYAITSTTGATVTERGIETAVGVLALEQVEKAERVLHEMNIELNKPTPSDDVMEKLSNQFYTLIPHKSHTSNQMHRQMLLIRTLDQLQQKQELVELMRDFMHATANQNAAAHLLDNQYAALRNEIAQLDRHSFEFQRLERELIESQYDGKREAEIVNIYSLNKGAETNSFKDKANRVGNVKQLYHASRGNCR
jgi:hypothetical protein